MKNKKGFTLIELMIVVAIIGILAALAIPDFMKMLAKSKQSEAKSNLGAIFTGQVAYFGEQNEYGSTFPQISWAPEGQNLYSYFINVGAECTVGHADQDCFSARKGVVCPKNTVSVPLSSQTAFIVGATGNVDNDDLCDEWSINETKILNNDINDVNLTVAPS